MTEFPAPPPPVQQAPPPPTGGPSGPRAGFWRRFGALLIDAILIGIVAGVFEAIFGRDAASVISLALGVAYYGYLEGSNSGQTIGKQLFDVAVIRDDRLPFDYKTAFLREVVVKWFLFGGVIFAFTLGLGWLLDILWPLWDDEHQALHDKVVSTHVIVA